MPSQSDIFGISGPKHLTSVDWSRTNHRRCVAASLVQGVYVLEKDRQKKRQGPQALALPWWDFFHFELNKTLEDDTDFSIFGAIFKFNPRASSSCSHNYSLQCAPKYVIAFRGTLLRPKSLIQDVKADLQIFWNRLHENPRFHLAMQKVQYMASVAGVQNIWLAGHSQGSSTAMLVGRNMAKKNFLIETYLFNPPFLSIPIGENKNPTLSTGIRNTSNFVKAGLTLVLKDRHQRSQDDLFLSLLSKWTPFVCVNPDDDLCSQYVGHFERRDKKKERYGAQQIERLAMNNSIRSLFWGAMGMDSEPLHLLPSAYLTINPSQSSGFIEAHSLEQWWKPDCHFQPKLYQLRKRDYYRCLAEFKSGNKKKEAADQSLKAYQFNFVFRGEFRDQNLH